MSRALKLVFRSIMAICGGYLVLALLNMAFVMLCFGPSGVGWGPAATLIFAIPYTALGSFLTGFSIAWVAGRSGLRHAGTVAGLMVAVTLMAMAMGKAMEPRWYQGAYALTVAPFTLLGGSVASNRRSRRSAE